MGAHLFRGEGVGISALFAGPVIIAISIAQIFCRRRGVGKICWRKRIEAPVPPERFFKRHARKAGTILERLPPDELDVVGDGDARKALATIERRTPDGSDAVGDDDACQAGAAKERKTSDRSDAVGDRDARKAGATGEHRIPDGSDAVRDDDFIKQ